MGTFSKRFEVTLRLSWRDVVRVLPARVGFTSNYVLERVRVEGADWIAGTGAV